MLRSILPCPLFVLGLFPKLTWFFFANKLLCSYLLQVGREKLVSFFHRVLLFVLRGNEAWNCDLTWAVGCPMWCTSRFTFFFFLFFLSFYVCVRCSCSISSQDRFVGKWNDEMVCDSLKTVKRKFQVSTRTLSKDNSIKNRAWKSRN
jgi:hypothetical protein